MASERLIDGLVAGLKPVRPRSRWRDAAILAGVGAAEIALVAMAMPMRSDMAAAMHDMMMWWKLGGSLCIALAGVAALLVLLTPDARPAAGRSLVLGVAAGVLLVGLALIAGGAMPMPGAMPDWREGLDCAKMVFVYGLPMLAATLFLGRRAAPARPRAAATAAGVASTGWGAVVFAWTCPYDNPVYIALWFGLALVAGALLGRLLLPRLLRW